MQIEPIGQYPQTASAPQTSGQQGVSFAEMVTNAIDAVTDAQSRADKAVERVAEGDLESVHDALLAIQQATQGIKLLVQVRNKVIEAYQEVMRTQI
ncbi:MAG: flagellar hook-basal body complex protein FliE [Armatimonadota bacterium]